MESALDISPPFNAVCWARHRLVRGRTSVARK